MPDDEMIRTTGVTPGGRRYQAEIVLNAQTPEGPRSLVTLTDPAGAAPAAETPSSGRPYVPGRYAAGDWRYNQDFFEVQNDGGLRTLARLDRTHTNTALSRDNAEAEIHATGQLMALAPALGAALKELALATDALVEYETGHGEGTYHEHYGEVERCLLEAYMVLEAAGVPSPVAGGMWMGWKAPPEPPMAPTPEPF